MIKTGNNLTMFWSQNRFTCTDVKQVGAGRQKVTVYSFAMASGQVFTASEEHVKINIQRGMWVLDN